LPATAVALLGLLFVWPRLAPRDQKFETAFANFNAKGVDTQSVVNPRYYGTDDKNQPYTVTAEIGTQVDTVLQAFSLTHPVADLTRYSGPGMVVDSDQGVFLQKDNALDLYGNVSLMQDKGYEVHSESAHVDIGPGNAQGDEFTHGAGPAGSAEGEGFRLWDRGDRIMFTGKAHALLHMTKSK
jgi:lipopolysaccharide export system protein LptC